jgi:mannosyltransferase
VAKLGGPCTLGAVATAVTPAPSALAPEETRSRPAWRHGRRRLPERGLARLGVVLAGAVVAAGVVLRFIAPNGLWLDEALSVNIAKLPLSQIPGALVQDGSPPLYYFVLHFWMVAFGQGEVAVRALSGVVSVATLPFLWMAGKRVGGRPAAWAALLLGASSPWAVYYGTDTRMYSLMALEAVLWYLAIRRAVEIPGRARLLCVLALTAALMYTHYWDLYLVGAGAVWALWRSLVEARRGVVQMGAYPRATRKVLLAMVGGVVLWLPWSPVFVFQALHTGTPWTSPPGPQDLLSVFGYFAGGGGWGKLLTFLLFGLVGLAVLARPGPKATSVVLEMRAQPRARFVAWLVVATLGVAVVAGLVSGAAFDSRYIAVVFPLFVLLCAMGLTTFASRRVTSVVLAVACVAGLFSARLWNAQPRTQAVQIAAVLNAQAQPGDMVVYCPDQLGPAVDRLLSVPDVTELTYPRMMGPQRIDWVDYSATIQGTSVFWFAQQIVSRLNPGSTLWLVWRNGYHVFGNSCGALASWLEMLHPGGETVRSQDLAYYEPDNLVRFSG